MTGVDHRAIAVAVGGILGASARWGLAEVVEPASGWPWATFIVNLLGSLLLGFVAFRTWRAPRIDVALRFGVGTGFCGALTTFSTFSLDIARFVEDERIGLAVGYGAASLVAGIALAAIGHELRGTER